MCRDILLGRGVCLAGQTSVKPVAGRFDFGEEGGAIKAETYWEDIGSRQRRRVLFAPSLLGADPLCVGAAIDRLGGCYDWLHLDIMDGHFRA